MAARSSTSSRSPSTPSSPATQSAGFTPMAPATAPSTPSSSSSSASSAMTTTGAALPTTLSTAAGGGVIATNLDIHRAVFNGDLERLKVALAVPGADVNAKDPVHGNTPLLIAVMRGNKPIVQYLLDHGALVKLRNNHGWSSLAESISYGDRALILSLWTVYKARSRDEVKRRTPEIMEKIETVGDFHLSINWKFSSWLPFVGRILPSDSYQIWKHGTYVRVDTTLVDFSGMSWKRGNVSYIVRLEKNGAQTAVALDNDGKRYLVLHKNGKPTPPGALTPSPTPPPAPLPQLTHEGKTEEEKKATTAATADTAAAPLPSITDSLTAPSTTAPPVVVATAVTTERPEGVPVPSPATPPTTTTTTTTTTSTAIVAAKKPSASTSSDILDEKDDPAERELDVDRFMAKPIESMTSPGKMEFTRQKSGWPGFRVDKKEKIGIYDAAVYSVKNINLSTSKRVEHLSEAEVKALEHKSNILQDAAKLEAKMKEEHAKEEAKAKALADGTTPTTGEEEEEEEEEVVHRTSIPPPDRVDIKDDDYFAGGNTTHLGRPIILKEEKKKFTAQVWMCDNFPLQLETILGILEMAAPRHPHVNKLREFVSTSLPPGFPVKIEMAVFPTITAQITFNDYSPRALLPHMFDIPYDYTLDDGTSFAHLQGIDDDNATAQSAQE